MVGKGMKDAELHTAQARALDTSFTNRNTFGQCVRLSCSLIASWDLQGVSHTCNIGELYHSESLQMNSVLGKDPDPLALSFQ